MEENVRSAARSTALARASERGFPLLRLIVKADSPSHTLVSSIMRVNYTASFSVKKKDQKRGHCERAQWVAVLAAKPHDLHFAERDLTLARCPLTFGCTSVVITGRFLNTS